MAVTEAVENYLETILILSELQPEVHAIDICSYLGYSRPTVSIILKKMKDDNLVTVDSDNHIQLTGEGKIIAERMYERHTIISEILMRLGVNKETAIADACKIEHDISDETFNAFKNHYKQYEKSLTTSEVNLGGKTYMDKFFEFRKKHPIFLYKNYHITENIDSIDIVYDFEIPELAEFHPSWSFVKPKNCSIKNDLTFERIAFSLGMVEAVSYWKSVCSPEMRVECGELDTEQIKWWKKLYFMGLGEFFYINHIQTDMENFMNISCNGSFKNTVEKSNAPIGCLVPIGGGKDSALTIETLKNAGIKCKCYSINKRVSVRDTVLTAGLNESDLIYSRRNFDRSLIKLNEKGYLNGHTPFSAIVAFSAEITAYLNDLKYIVLSNEASANETTVIDSDVNHQYSKSFEFENDFHNYESRFLKTNIYYFSFLRPLSELQIAKMFAAHKKYLPVFRSCNLGSKVSPDIWCAECPKCLFVSLILSPFVTSQELTDIFGKNLIDDEDMLDYFTKLIGKSEHKPFECVGSIDEVNLAVQMTIKKYLKEKTPIPLLLEKYMEMGLYSPDGIDEKAEEYMSKYNDVNLLPEKFELILKEEMERIL